MFCLCSKLHFTFSVRLFLEIYSNNPTFPVSNHRHPPGQRRHTAEGGTDELEQTTDDPGGLTCQRGRVSEGPHLGVRQPREQGDDRVHHVLVVDDAVLALANQHADELAEVVAELLPQRAGHGERVVAAVLWTRRRR